MKKIISAIVTGVCLTVMTACQAPQTIQVPSPSAPIINNDKPIMMCTMQYDPVCVKTVNQGIISYQTYSNACMAGNATNVVSMDKGACEKDNVK